MLLFWQYADVTGKAPCTQHLSFEVMPSLLKFKLPRRQPAVEGSDMGHAAAPWWCHGGLHVSLLLQPTRAGLPCRHPGGNTMRLTILSDLQHLNSAPACNPLSCVVQALLTVLGNATCAVAAYRIFSDASPASSK